MKFITSESYIEADIVYYKCCEGPAKENIIKMSDSKKQELRFLDRIVGCCLLSSL